MLGPMPPDTPNPLHSLLAPNAPLTPFASPQCPTPLPVGVLEHWTGAQCGWGPSPPATPNAPTPPASPPSAP